MKNNINSLLEDFGLSKTQSDIFIFLYKYGTKTASTVAKSIGKERTNVYKTMKNLVNKGIISEITKNGVKYFFITNKNIIGDKIEEEYIEIKKKRDNLDILNKELKTLESESYGERPKITFFEGVDGLKQLYKSMYRDIKEKKYIQIKMFASNTLENKSNLKFTNYGENFISKLKKEKISIEAYLGNGMMLLENIVRTYNTDIIKDLPAQNSAINTFIFGDFVYVIIFKQTPFGIKIENEEFAGMLHFLLDKVEVKLKE